MSCSRCAVRGPERSTSRPASTTDPARKTSLKSKSSLRRRAPPEGLPERLAQRRRVWLIGGPTFKPTRSMPAPVNSYPTGPAERGHFGIFGGRYVAETLMPLILAVERAYNAAKTDPEFKRELGYYLKNYVGRPSPPYFPQRPTRH